MKAVLILITLHPKINKMRIIFVILLIYIIVISCNSDKNNVNNTIEESNVTDVVKLTNEQFSSANITIGKLQQSDISSVIRINGKIEVPPQNMVSVSMPLGGFLSETGLLTGMHVNKNDIIAKLEDQLYIQLQQDYLTTKNKLVFSEKEFERQKELNASKASSDKVFQTAEMEYTKLKIELNALSERLKLIHINPELLNEKNISKSVNLYSPIDGFVSKVNVNIGKYVNPSDVLFELVNPDDIHLNLKIFEKDVPKIKIGQKLIAYNNNEQQKKYACEIILISKDIDADGTVEIHCHFTNYDNTLLPGMYMNAEINIENKNAYILPENAVIYSEGKNYIFVATSNNTFKMTEVETGIKSNDNIEIINYTNLVNSNIVLKGAYTLYMSLKNIPEDE